jgi:hypothetical protein
MKKRKEKLSTLSLSHFTVRKKNIAVLSLYVMLSQYMLTKMRTQGGDWEKEREKKRKRVNNIKVFFFLASCTIFSMRGTACGGGVGEELHPLLLVVRVVERKTKVKKN